MARSLFSVLMDQIKELSTPQSTPSLPSTPSTVPTGIVSSTLARKTIGEQLGNLQQLEQSVAPLSGTLGAIKLPEAQEATKLQSPTQTTQITQAGKSISLPTEQVSGFKALVNVASNNPSIQNIVSQLNEIIKNPLIQKNLTPEIRQNLSSIVNIESSNQALGAQAREELNKNNFVDFNRLMNQVTENQRIRDRQLIDLQNQLQPFREKFLTAMLPTEEEKTLQQQLADLRLSTKEGELLEFGRGRPLAISVGRAGKIREQGLALEKNIVDRLGIAQQNRQLQAQIAKQGLDFVLQDAELRQKVYQAQENREDRLFDQALKLNTLQRQQLADVLDFAKGVDPDNLDVSSRNQLAQLAIQQDIPFDLMTAGLQAQYDRDQLDIKTKELGLEKTRAEIGKTTKEVAPTEMFVGVPIEKQNVRSAAIVDSFNALGSRLTKDQRLSLNSSLNGYLQRGDLENAKNVLISSAISSLPTEQQNKAFGRLTAIDSLNRIEELLNEYTRSGGKTDILKGTQEKIFQKLGTTTDPQLSEIGNEIQLAIIAYRNAVSGAAFTELELKQYENVFPSIGKNLILNESKIKSLRNVFNNNQKSVLSIVLGGKQNYDFLIEENVKINIPQTKIKENVSNYIEEFLKTRKLIK